MHDRRVTRRDTPRKSDDSGTIVSNDRSENGLWRASNAAGISRDVIVRVHRDAKNDRVTATDDAALCETIGNSR